MKNVNIEIEVGAAKTIDFLVLSVYSLCWTREASVLLVNATLDT